MTSLDSLKRVLKEEIEGCRSLLELLQEEKRRLVNLELDEVESVVKAKDILILKLRLLEEERVRVVDRLEAEPREEPLDPNVDFPKVNLKRLAERFGDEELLALRSKLISLTQSIQEMSAFNRVMIDRTLEFIRKNTPLLSKNHSLAPESEKGRVFSRAT